MNIVEALRLSRQSRKMTQQQLADRAGVSRQAIVLLESSAGRLSTLLAVLDHAPVKFHNLPQPKNGLHARIRAAREANQLTIADVARAAKVSINTVKSIEAGGGTVSTLTKIMKIVAPRATAVHWPEKPAKHWKSVAGRPNPDRDFSDYYATPAPIGRLLLDHEHFEGSILEPAVGKARVLEHVLMERGYSNITCSDLLGEGAERRDFFDITEKYDCIVTNPPFNQHVDFILHAKRIAKDKICLLIPLNYLTGKRRHSEVWADTNFPLARLIVMNRGISFLSEDPFADRVAPSQLYCAWFIFQRGHVGPPTLTWIDNHALIDRVKSAK